jgi:hypothetical protein
MKSQVETGLLTTVERGILIEREEGSLLRAEAALAEVSANESGEAGSLSERNRLKAEAFVQAVRSKLAILRSISPIDHPLKKEADIIGESAVCWY